MKAHGFENTAPQPEKDRKVEKSFNSQSVGDNYIETAVVKNRLNPVRLRRSVRIGIEDSSKGRFELGQTGCIDSGNNDSVDENGSEVSYGIARRSLEDGFRLNFICGAVVCPDSESPDSRLSRIRRNIADGYYNSPEFIEKLADTLIDKLYLAGDGQ